MTDHVLAVARPFRSPQMATRAMFALCGVAAAGWGALIPFVKQRLGLDDADLGLLLLAPGAAAVLGAPLAAFLLNRLGSRGAAFGYGIAAVASVPLLAFSPSAGFLVAALLLFGFSMSGFGVSINAQAMAVERQAGRRMMSSFHALFSVGGLVGSVLAAGLFALALQPMTVALLLGALLALLLATQWRNLMADKPEPAATSADAGAGRRRGPGLDVVLPGLAILIMYLSEAALLDWSAVFLRFERGWSPADAPLGYGFFSAAMMVGRFSGDRIVGRFGAVPVIVLGAALAAAGFVLAVVAAHPLLALLGFVCIGLGCANIVPQLMGAAGRLPQTAKPVAISAISAMGSTGLLMGPGAVGLVSHASSLATVWLALGLLLLVVAALAVRLRRVLG